MRRSYITAFITFLIIPVIIFAEVRLFQNQNYMLASVGILFVTMLPFFMAFEKRKPRARELVLIAMMCALTVCIQLFCTVTIPIKAGSAMVMIAGIALGPEAGFLIGAMSRFLLNFYQGQGPWTPWEMFSWGILGFLAGFAFCKAELQKKEKVSPKDIAGPLFCMIFMELMAWISYLILPMGEQQFWGWRVYVFGAVGLVLSILVQRKRFPVDEITLTGFTFFIIFVVYGGIMNICALVTGQNYQQTNGIGLDALKILYLSGVPYDAMHAGTAAIFMFLFGEKIIRKLERIKIKYGIYK